MGDAKETFEKTLGQIVKDNIPGCLALKSCEQLSGGASQETYRITIETSQGDQILAMRRAPGGVVDDTNNTRPGLEIEAKLFRCARQAGVPEPEIFHVLQEADGLGRGFIMEWLEGEALGARIARSDAFAQIRPKLAFECGEVLARIHGIELEATGLDKDLHEMTAADFVTQTWDNYKLLETPQPMIDFAGRWLMENLPEVDRHCLIHNDFRNGNIMMTPEDGIVAVLDWEIAHIGDPMRDLGWICTNSWRFGKTELPVGGFGSREDLFAGYESVSGAKVNPAHVKFWEVFGSFWWSVGCLGFAARYRTGGVDATVERPGIGRRTSECQVDCVNLIIPGPVGRPEPKAMTLSSDMPNSEELLASVRDYLREDVMEETSGRNNFLARVASNSLDIVLRELELGPAHLAFQQNALEKLLGRSGDLIELKWALTHALRDGSMPLDQSGLPEFLRQSVVTQIAIDQPKYSGYKTALKQARP